jgi:hypothetical protein
MLINSPKDEFKKEDENELTSFIESLMVLFFSKNGFNKTNNE